MPTQEEIKEGNLKFWLKADDPFQFLLVAREYVEAMRSERPEEYISHVPIHMDGSCNGLQHYAALGGDPEGAQAVNLMDSDRPQDVYSNVASKVQAAIAIDAANPESPNHAIAVLLNGKISRKVVKQTVMTNVYGVTFVGAIEQIRKRLAELKIFTSSDDLKKAAIYVARETFTSLKGMFSGATRIQEWLVSCAREISRSINRGSLEEILERRRVILEELDDEIESYLAQVSPLNAKLFCHRMMYVRKSLRGQSSAGVTSIVSPSLANPATPELGVLETSKISRTHNEFPELLVQSFLKANKEKSGNAVERQKKTLAEYLSSKHTLVVWTTPLGLPIVQPYSSSKPMSVSTSLQSFTVYFDSKEKFVDMHKQKAAFPPNFIHSMDASHMLMTAIASKESQLCFAAVHDSYWTHACDVDKLNEIIRMQFVALHKQPIMRNLYDEFRHRYADHYIISRRRFVDDEYENSSFKMPLRDDEEDADPWIHKFNEQGEHYRKCCKMINQLSKSIQLKSRIDTIVKNLATYDPDQQQQYQQQLQQVSQEHPEEQKLQPDALQAAAKSTTKVAKKKKKGAPSKTTTTTAAGSDAIGSEEESVEEGEENAISKKKKVPIEFQIQSITKVRFPQIPEKGSFDIDAVNQSKYFFA